MPGTRLSLRELSRIAFDPSFPDLQLQVYRSLVLSVLSTRRVGQVVVVEEVSRELSVNLGLETVPSLLVASALTSLEKDGIVIHEEPVWRLTKPVMLPAESPLDKLHKGFLETLKTRFGETDRYQEQIGLASFEDLVISLVEDLGQRAVALLLGKPREALRGLNIPSIVATRFSSFAGSYVERIAELEKAVTAAILEVFERLEGTWLDALGTVVNRAVICRIMAAEPATIALTGRLFRDMAIVLDTNVVFALVCKGSVEHKETRWIAEAAKSLGIELVVQDSTLGEFERTITKDTLRFRAQQGSYLDPAFASRDLPRTYYRFKQEYGDWYGLVAAVRLGVSKLNEDFGIRTIPTKSVDLPPDLTRPAAQLIQEETRLERPKDEDALEHDARSIVFIHAQREGPERPRIGNPWMLTRDYGLLRADAKFSRRIRSPLPAVIGYDLLSQLISPFLKVKSALEFHQILGKLIASRVAPLTYEDTLQFASYALDQLGIEPEERDVVSVASEAHASRVLQAFSAGDFSRGFQDLKLSVERAFATTKTTQDREATIARLVNLIKETSPGRLFATQTQSSGIAVLSSSITSKLRLTIATEGCPADEYEVQRALNAMLRVLDYKVTWNSESIPFAGRKFIPDFVVDLGKVSVPIEVKLVPKEERKSAVVEEMAADLTAYRAKYETTIFVVYDCGFVADVGHFSGDFERQGAIVLVIKH